MIRISAALAATLLCAPVLAQHDHAQHHASYQSWENRDGKGCCNGRDCDAIAESDERETGGALFVFVRGVGKAKGQAAWCPVLPRHYLRSGNVPNASVSHACVTDHYHGETPCEQFICYQPRPKG